MGFLTPKFVEFFSTTPGLDRAVNEALEQKTKRTDLVFIQISALFIHFLAQNCVAHAQRI